MKLYNHRSALSLLFWTTTSLVAANTEKTIFLGPPTTNIPLQNPTISDLNLNILTPDQASIRTNLTRVFPTDSKLTGGEVELDQDDLNAAGYSSWFVLDGLTEGQRYELRVCWSALQPTSFSLQVYELNTVWQIPELIQSLAAYASSQLPSTFAPVKDPSPEVNELPKREVGEAQKSILLLRVVAAADYFSDDVALMQSPPPVLVDVILDPYLNNMLPRSLMLTAVYIVFVAIATFFVARWYATNLRAIGAKSSPDVTKKRQ